MNEEEIKESPETDLPDAAADNSENAAGKAGADNTETPEGEAAEAGADSTETPESEAAEAGADSTETQESEAAEAGADGAESAGDRPVVPAPKKKMPTGLKIALIALISVVGLAVVAAGIGFAYYQHIFNQIILPETEEYVVPPESEDFVTDDPDESHIWIDETDETSDTETVEPGTSPEDSYPDTTGDDVTTEGDSHGDTMTAPGKSSLTSEKVTYQDPASVVWPEDAHDLGDDGLINIMLVGQDNGNFKSRGRSDSMILLSVNPSTGGIALVSFLRDTYVKLGNGYSDNRLNTAYKFGGFPMMFDVMKRNFGITCDYGVVVNFESFIDIIDTLGGVDLSFTEKEVNNLVKNGFGEYPDGSVAKIGLNKNVPGRMALAYARIRKIDSDFSRTARQRKLLMSVYNRFKSSSLTTILKLVDNVKNYIRLFGMTSTELLGLVSTLYPLIGNEVKSYSVPGSGEYTYARMRGMSVVLPKLDKIRESLKKKLPLGTADSPVTADKTTEPPVLTTEDIATDAPSGETTGIPGTTDPVTGIVTDFVTDEMSSIPPGPAAEDGSSAAVSEYETESPPETTDPHEPESTAPVTESAEPEETT